MTMHRLRNEIERLKSQERQRSLVVIVVDPDKPEALRPAAINNSARVLFVCTGVPVQEGTTT